MKKSVDIKLVFSLLVILLLIMSIVSMTFGDANISVYETYSIIINKIKNLMFNKNMSTIASTGMSSREMIILNIRVPRILTAIFVGMGLSSVGCAYQGVFKNPMTDPYILGISSGATLGAAIMIVLNKSNTFMGLGLVTFGAFLGAMITTLIVYLIALKNKKISTTSILLSGIAISYLISAVLSFILVFNEKNVSKIIYWTMGSLVGVSYKQLAILIPIVILGIFILYRYSKELDILVTGEEVAMSLGIDTSKTKISILLISSLIVAVCVSFTGVIGFVGLMIPHIARMLVGPRHQKLIPIATILGAIFLVFSDTIARSLIDAVELPIGAVTALFGAPYFIYLLIIRKRRI